MHRALPYHAWRSLDELPIDCMHAQPPAFKSTPKLRSHFPNRSAFGFHAYGPAEIYQRTVETVGVPI